MNAWGVFFKDEDMPVKPPRGGSTPVDVNASAGASRSAEVDTSLPTTSGRRGSASDISVDHSRPGDGASDGTAGNETKPLAVVMVHAASAEALVIPGPSSLENYLISAGSTLPDANSSGLRVFKSRTYVDLSIGGTVLVGADPDTGLYRARRSSELRPSGPVLERDSASGLWRLHEDVGATIREQFKRSFPEAADEHAQHFNNRFGDRDSAEIELERIKFGFPQLDRELGAWEKAYKGSDTEERDRRFALGAKVRQLFKWLGDASERIHQEGFQTGFVLKLAFGRKRNFALPVLSTRLDSIVALEITEGAVGKLEGLFKSLSHIETLKVQASLDGLPAGIETLTELKVLDMSRTGVLFKPADVDRFTRMSRLQELNLENGRVLHAPSVRGLTELRVLNLRYTGINALPAGLSEMPGPSRLQVLDLGRNRGLKVAPDVSAMSELRILDLADTGISRLPVGLDSGSGPSRLEILNLSANDLYVAPSLRGMTALQELDLSWTRIDRLPEGITADIPKTKLILKGNDIQTIPESLELRKGFDLSYNPISDPAALRRFIFARRQTGTDVWLGRGSTDLSANLWLKNVPPAQLPDKLALWNRWSSVPESDLMLRIRHLSGTPEFHIERPLLQRRVWAFLEAFDKADAVEQAQLRAVAGRFTENEPIIGVMLERLEAEIEKFDARRQHVPPHQLPKRPRFE
ncbi:leucine-rich repeat domain-containing protein [Pseudomonas sp. 14A]|uniref:leucine-rich repeat domain-containing protein n=1 Tax=Pseudomonas sp. 14A TaxID=2823142 RepID=UPI001B836E64|nr:leucine-rich repeat domain-containing protein [Pseudomonas sp. 14A]MBR7195500.1 leucine-rich repeat domain-containing protein [Pseudomonas sp. 14A]